MVWNLRQLKNNHQNLQTGNKFGALEKEQEINEEVNTDEGKHNSFQQKGQEGGKTPGSSRSKNKAKEVQQDHVYSTKSRPLGNNCQIQRLEEHQKEIEGKDVGDVERDVHRISMNRIRSTRRRRRSFTRNMRSMMSK